MRHSHKQKELPDERRIQEGVAKAHRDSVRSGHLAFVPTRSSSLIALYARRQWGYVALSKERDRTFQQPLASMAPVGIGLRRGLGGCAGFRLRMSGQRTIYERLPNLYETLDSRCEAPDTKTIAANELQIVAPHCM